MRITDVSKLKGPLGELHDQLFGENGEERLAEFNLWLKRVTVRVLKLVATVYVCGAKRFVASAAFGENNPAGIKFWLNDTFKNHLLGKIEENVPAGELAVHNLEKPSVDGPIREELGDREKTFLAYVYELIAQGTLSNDKVYIFYVPDDKGDFWAVGVGRDSLDREWRVSADSVAGPNPWYRGDQVVSQVSRS